MSELGSFVSSEPLDPTPATPVVQQPDLPPVPTDAVPEDGIGAGWRAERVIAGEEFAAASRAVDDPKRPEELSSIFEIDTDSPSWLENTMAVVQSAGVLSGTVEGVGEGIRNIIVDSTPDPDFSLEAMAEDPKYSSLFKEMRDNYETDLAYQELYPQLLLAPNAEYAGMLFDRAKRQREFYKILQDAGWSSYAVGLVGTIGADIVATKGVMTMAALANIGKVAQLGRLSRIAETAASQRLLGAARVAQFGVIEGGLEVGIQKATDPYMTGFDVALALGLGGGIGSILGAGFPKAIAGIGNRETLEAALIQQEVALKAMREVHTPGAAGAAPVPAQELEKLTEMVPTKGGGATLLASKITKVAPILSKIRAPQVLARDTWARGYKEMQKTGLKGEYHFGNVVQRILKTSVMTADEIGGQVARTKTVREALQEVETQVTASQFRVERSYLTAVKEAFDVGTARARLGMNQINELREGGITKRALNGAPTLAEVQWKADTLAAARANSAVESTIEGYKKEWKEQGLSDAQVDRMIKAVEEIELTDSAFYNSNKSRLVTAGLLEESELIDGYRPQNWNRDELINNMPAAKAMLLRVFADEAPPEEWVNGKVGARLLNDEPLPEGHADLGRPAIDLENGERWDDFARANPLKALELAREHYDLVRAAQVEHAESFAIAMEQSHKLKVKDLGEGFVERLEGHITKARSSVVYHKKRLASAYKEPGTPWNMKKIDEAARGLGRAEKRLADLEETVRNTRGAAERIADDFTAKTSRAVRELEEQIKKSGTAAQKRALKRSTKTTRSAQKGVARKLDTSTVMDRVDEAYKLLTKGESAYGWIPESLRNESNHFKHRGINLRHHILDPETARFLNRDSASAKRGYGNSALRELNTVELLGPLVGHRAGDDIEGMYKNFREFALKEFDEDLKKAPGKLKEITKKRQDAEQFIDALLAMVTRKDLMKYDIKTAQMIATVQAGISASQLGFVLASQLADVGLLAFAGGALGVGFRSLFRSTSKIFDEMIENGDDLIAMGIRGTAVQNQSAFMSRIDADNLITDIPGGRMRTISRTVQNLAQIEGWANLMHVWNRWIRQSFGVDFAKQITRDMDRYETLDDNLKGFYAKHGISESDAKLIREYMAKSHKVYDNGTMRIPDLEGWLEFPRGSEMLDKYMRAVRGAGDEALIDPALGDRPFLASNPLGRLVLQFSSFSYTAGERFFAPLWQAGRLNKRDTRVWGAVLSSLLMTVLADGWRHHARGKGEEWRNSWDTEQGAFNNFKRAYMRSNFIFGMTGIGIDVGAGVGATAANNTWKAITDSDFDIINPEYARLNYGQRWTGLLGPAGGMVGTLERTVTDLSDGNWDKVSATAAARAPIANSLILWTMAEAIKDITGD